MGAFHLMAWPSVFLCINGKIWSMFLKYLAKMDLILYNFVKIFRSDRSEAQTFYLSFNNLTVLTLLAVLMESAQWYRPIHCRYLTD
jgi:hypothetical protein